jgi:hypothetical protein
VIISLSKNKKVKEALGIPQLEALFWGSVKDEPHHSYATDIEGTFFDENWKVQKKKKFFIFEKISLTIISTGI